MSTGRAEVLGLRKIFRTFSAIFCMKSSIFENFIKYNKCIFQLNFQRAKTDRTKVAHWPGGPKNFGPLTSLNSEVLCAKYLFFQLNLPFDCFFNLYSLYIFSQFILSLDIIFNFTFICQNFPPKTCHLWNSLILFQVSRLVLKAASTNHTSRRAKLVSV